MVPGEAWWGGKWVPSCQACAKVLHAAWREAVRSTECSGCGKLMESSWPDPPKPR